MSFVDCIHDARKNKIRVAERDSNGNRILVDHDAEYVFYYTHPSGSTRSMYGDPVKKYSTNDGQKFRKELARFQNDLDRHGKPKYKIFESDINPVFRALETHYKGSEAPTLNLAFFDIETGFDDQRGFAPIDDPFNPITAISIYLSHVKRLITLVLTPPTMTNDEAQEMCDKFEDTFLFDDEKELLRAFIGVIEDSDVLSGWNCVPKTEPVWLKDRIVPLSDIKPNDETVSDGSVIRYHNSGMKTINTIKLINGQTLRASYEHRIPVCIKARNEYKNPNSLMSTRIDLTVKQIKEKIDAGFEVYSEIALRSNDNKDWTYREYIMENISQLWDMDWFDISVAIEKDSVKEAIVSDPELRPLHKRYVSSCHEYRTMWTAKKLDWTKERVVSFLEKYDTHTFCFKGSRPFELDIDTSIERDVLQILGLQFTDGSLDWKKNPMFVIYGSDLNQLSKYREMTRVHLGSKSINGSFPPNRGCGSFHYSFGNKIGLLYPLIYKNKSKGLNLTLCSRLSDDQFFGFISGIIDGDGWISSEHKSSYIGICNYDGSILDIQQLLAWNGVYSVSYEEKGIRIPARFNYNSFSKLSLCNEKRKYRLEKMDVIQKTSHSPSKRLNKYVFHNHAIVKIKEIISSDEMVPMADIETENHYFTASGIRVHNSTFFDVPYIVNRMKRIIDEDSTRDLCLWRQKPRQRFVQKYGRDHETYDLVGRAHLDYLELYQKHNPQQQQSYRLDYIGEIEVGENKVPYDGTLDDLYKKDFFKFIEYSRQDVALLVKIDEKKRFIELANQIAHVNCVQLKTTMGSVALVEQAIILEMHDMGLVAPNRRPRDEDDDTEIVDLNGLVDDDEDGDGEEFDPSKITKQPVVGAYVAKPKVGLQSHVAAVDINSLYPSTIRALNISPETIVGQVRDDETKALIKSRIDAKVPRAEAWDGVFASLEFDHMMAKDGAPLTIDFEDGTTKVMSGRQLYDYIFNPKNNLCISANGTIFRTDKDGIIPMLLAKWYEERKGMQGKAKFFNKLSKGLDIDPSLAQAIEEQLKLMG